VQVYFEELQGLEAYISNAETVEEISGELKVDAFNYNFTTDYSNGYWVVIKAEDGSVKGDYKTKMIFSYFEFDPNCDAFTNWNGTDCVPDYDSYCE